MFKAISMLTKPLKHTKNIEILTNYIKKNTIFSKFHTKINFQKCFFELFSEMTSPCFLNNEQRVYRILHIILSIHLHQIYHMNNMRYSPIIYNLFKKSCRFLFDKSSKKHCVAYSYFPKNHIWNDLGKLSIWFHMTKYDV